MRFYTRDNVENVGRAGASYDGIKARFLNTFWLYLEPDDRAFTPHWSDGFWEAWITVWMDRELDFADVFVDVGANVGYYSFMAASVGITTIAFEPQKHLVELLNKSEWDNKTACIQIYDVALSDKTGHVNLSAPTGHSGAGSIIGDVGDNSHSEQVFTITFDELTKHYKTGRNWLIKIDAEGAEPQIWAGMKEFRSKHDATIILEWAPSRYEDAGQFADELLEYDVTRVDYDGNEQPVTKESLMAIVDFEMIVVRCN